MTLYYIGYGGDSRLINSCPYTCFSSPSAWLDSSSQLQRRYLSNRMTGITDLLRRFKFWTHKWWTLVFCFKELMIYSVHCFTNFFFSFVKFPGKNQRWWYGAEYNKLDSSNWVGLIMPWLNINHASVSYIYASGLLFLLGDCLVIYSEMCLQIVAIFWRWIGKEIWGLHDSKSPEFIIYSVTQ